MHDLKRIQQLLLDRTGLAFNESKQATLHRHITDAMKAASIDTVSNYYVRLWGTTLDYYLWRDLVERLTVGETYFFRNAGHFDALRHHILPEIIERKRQAGTPILRLWSAGCSTGEEPYSLAILLRELLPDLSKWTVSILATDINHDHLNRAREALYTERSFRTETPDYVKNRYFKAEDGRYRLLPIIKQNVRLDYLNLIDGNYPAADTYTLNIDLILCRNVTIYFTPEVTRKVVGKLYRSLNTNGYLIVGHSEPQLGLYDQVGFQPENISQVTVYRKRAEQPHQPKTEKVTPLVSSMPTVPPATPTRPTPPRKATPEKEPPPTPQEYCQQARELSNKNQFDEAHKLLDQAIKQDTFCIEAYYIKALLYQDQEDYQAALNALKRALYIDRRFVLGHFYVGMLNWQLNQRDEAAYAWRITRKLLKALPSETVLEHGDGIQAGRLLHIVNTYAARIGTSQLNAAGGHTP